MISSEKNKIKKVAIVGPECTGKSDLSEYLAKHFDTAWVAEYARAYLDNINRPYEQSDLTKIAHGQIRMEDEGLSDANQILICDTNLIVIKIWSDYKYGHCDKEIINLINSRSYDLHLLTSIDVPWQADPLREHPDKREQLYDLYKTELNFHRIPFIEIKGTREERREKAVLSISKLLKGK